MIRQTILSTAIAGAAILLVVSGCGKSDSSQTASEATNHEVTPFSAPADYLGAMQKGKQAAERTVDVASITKAIQMFNVENGRNPKTLNELVEEKYLPKIPEAPYGMQINYDPASGKVTVTPKPQQK